MMNRFIFLVLLACGISSAAILPVNTARASDISGSNISTIDTTIFNSTAGNATIVWTSWFNPSTPPTTSPVTDQDGTVYTLINCSVSSTTSKDCIFIGYPSVTTVGTNKITVVFTGTGLYVTVLVRQYSGVALVSAVDVVRQPTDPFNTTLTTTSFSTSQNDEVLIFAARNGGGVGLIYNAGPGFSIVVQDADGVTALEEQIVSSGASGTASISCTTGAGWLGMFVSLKAAAAPTTSPKINISIQ